MITDIKKIRDTLFHMAKERWGDVPVAVEMKCWEDGDVSANAYHILGHDSYGDKWIARIRYYTGESGRFTGEFIETLGWKDRTREPPVWMKQIDGDRYQNEGVIEVMDCVENSLLY